MRLPLLALAALVAAQEPAKVPIAWTVKKEQKIRYEFVHKITTSDGTRDTDLQLTIGIGLEGGDTAADGTTGLKLTVERIASLKIAGEEREDYDSARDKTPPEGSYPRVLSKCVGRTLSIRIGASGTLTAIEEIRAMVQAAVDSFPDLAGRRKWNAAGVDLVARRMEWLLKAGFETPRGGPAAVGDTWETKFDSREITKGLGSAVCRARLKEVRAGEAIVEQTMKFEFPDALAASVKEASGRGSLTWDTERGVLKSLSLSSRLRTAAGDANHTVTVAQLK